MTPTPVEWVDQELARLADALRGPMLPAVRRQVRGNIDRLLDARLDLTQP